MVCNKLGVWKQLYAQMTAGEERSWENVELLEINQENNEKGKMHQVISSFQKLAVQYPGRGGEGNGNPLQCSCLENPRDGWDAIYGVAQSRTWLKRLSSNIWTPPYLFSLWLTGIEKNYKSVCHSEEYCRNLFFFVSDEVLNTKSCFINLSNFVYSFTWF